MNEFGLQLKWLISKTALSKGQTIWDWKKDTSMYRDTFTKFPGPSFDTE